MAYLFVPETKNARLPVFFNVREVVGAQPARNLREDVLFVQFALNQWAKRDPESFNKQRLEVTGTVDALTIQFIHILQGISLDCRNARIRAFMPSKYTQTPLRPHGDKSGDGRVSPAKKGYSYGNHDTQWTIVSLNRVLQDDYMDIWPRIDRIPDCPIDVAKMCINELRGTG